MLTANLEGIVEGYRWIDAERVDVTGRLVVRRRSVLHVLPGATLEIEGAPILRSKFVGGGALLAFGAWSPKVLYRRALNAILGLFGDGDGPGFSGFHAAGTDCGPMTSSGGGIMLSPSPFRRFVQWLGWSNNVTLEARGGRISIKGGDGPASQVTIKGPAT